METNLIINKEYIDTTCAKSVAYQKLAMRPIAHHYEQDGEASYVKYTCPICGNVAKTTKETEEGRFIGFSIPKYAPNCPCCGINLSWKFGEETRELQTESSLGNRITELLKKANMTQRELAKKVHVSDVSMSRYIKGERTPNGTTIAKIATVFYTTTDYLLNGDTSDFDSEYHEIHRFIVRNATQMSFTQRRELINVLLDSYET